MRLNQSAVASWLDEVTASDPLPELHVSPHAPDLLEQSIDGLRAVPSFEERDPGCYLFFIDRTEARRTWHDDSRDLRALAAQITSMASVVNRRLEVEWESSAYDIEQKDAQASQQRDEFGSYILLSDGLYVPSIGPGGHVFIEERQETIVGSASVRPFIESQQARSWISADAVFNELVTFLGEELEFFPALGYYEDSWMERQAVIRPTIAFVIETGESVPYPEKWVVTIPATITNEPIELFIRVSVYLRALASCGPIPQLAVCWRRSGRARPSILPAGHLVAADLGSSTMPGR